MHLKFPYIHTSHKDEAYQVFLKQFETDEFRSLGIEVEIEQLGDEINVSGKGFKLNAIFDEHELVMTFDLSLYLKPFANKIEGKISSIVSHCI